MSLDIDSAKSMEVEVKQFAGLDRVVIYADGVHVYLTTAQAEEIGKAVERHALESVNA